MDTLMALSNIGEFVKNGKLHLIHPLIVVQESIKDPFITQPC